MCLIFLNSVTFAAIKHSLSAKNRGESKEDGEFCLHLHLLCHTQRNIRRLSHMNKSVLWAVQSVCVCLWVRIMSRMKSSEGPKSLFTLESKIPWEAQKGLFITMGALVMLLQTLFTLFQHQAPVLGVWKKERKKTMARFARENLHIYH